MVVAYKLYIFDLDDTLVFTNLSEEESEEGFNTEQEMMENIRKDIKEGKIILAPDVKNILEKLKKRGILMAIASHSTIAKEILTEFQLKDYFHMIVNYYPKDPEIFEDKSPMIKLILDTLNINKKEAVFFDNNIRHIDAINKFGVKSYVVHEKHGIEKYLINYVLSIKKEKSFWNIF
jgi:HAD superfamily phosphatase (TIGR01681 family)